MTRPKATLLVGVAVAALIGYASAQTIVPNSLTGNECWNAGQGLGGPGVTVCAYLTRNGTALKTFSGSGAQTYTATTLDSTLMWTGTAPTTWTITTPVAPFDGEILTIGTDTTLTTLVTLTANTGQTLNTTFTSQTINAKASVEFQYSLAAAKWYELR